MNLAGHIIIISIIIIINIIIFITQVHTLLAIMLLFAIILHFLLSHTWPTSGRSVIIQQTNFCLRKGV